MEVNLTSEEIAYLLISDVVPSQIVNELKGASNSTDTLFSLKISDDDADTLRDRLGEELQRDGFDEAYNLTRKGKVLESLVDKLFVG